VFFSVLLPRRARPAVPWLCLSFNSLPRENLAREGIPFGLEPFQTVLNPSFKLEIRILSSFSGAISWPLMK
jgi:hypothetical protein